MTFHSSKRIFAGILAICALATFPALAGDLQQQDIFIRGQEGYHTYRIPSLIVASNGTVLAFCEARKNSGSDTGDIDLVLKRSADGGKTWGKTQIVWDDGANTCGNPCPVVDRDTGTIWLLLTHNLGEDHERDIKSKSARGTRTVWISRSGDNGKTWSAPADITSSTKDPSWAWYATGPGVGIQIQHGAHKGRLVIPCDHSYAATDTPEKVISGSHIIFSDDHGKNWKLGGVARPQMNECQVVELADNNGTLLLSMRNQHDRDLAQEKRDRKLSAKTKKSESSVAAPSELNQRAESISHDGGATWTAPERRPQLLDPICQASILRYDWPQKKERGKILFSNPADATRRHNLTVRLSYDDAKTWAKEKVIHQKDAAYSCLAVLPDGQIGCLYERGETNAYEKITFARFPFAWLEADQ